MRKFVPAAFATAVLCLIPAANAAADTTSPASVLGGISCSTRPDGVRFCGSLIVNKQAVPARTLARS